MLPPILALVLLVFAFGLGLRRLKSRAALASIGVAWLATTVISFLVAGVADDDDVGAFLFSAVVLLLLAYALWRLGSRLQRRRA